MTDSQVNRLLAIALSDAIDRMADDDSLVLVCADLPHEIRTRDELAADSLALSASIKAGR